MAVGLAAHAAPRKPPAFERENPPALDLTSDTMTVTPGSRAAVATGNVLAKGATWDAQCRHADATYNTPAGGRRTIETLALHEEIHLHRASDGLVAVSSEAVYEEATGKVVLTGDPVVTRRGDVLRGERIVVGVRDDALEVDHVTVNLVRRKGAADPVQVRAEHLTSLDAGKHLRFERNVQLKEGKLNARADRMDAYMERTGATDQSQLSQVVMTGHVEASRGDDEATSRTATYLASSGDLVLQGDPQLTSEGSDLKGEQIIINGSTGRAHAVSAKAHLREHP